MIDEEILELRRKLDESITKEKNYDKTYRLSVELDDLITKYYNKKLMKTSSVDVWKNIKEEWRCVKTFSLFFIYSSRTQQYKHKRIVFEKSNAAQISKSF